MSVRIKQQRCDLCGICIDVCPGNLLMKKENKILIRAPEECWDCAACVKECSNQALELYLPAEIGGRGATLQAKKKGNKRVWICKRPDNTKEKYTTLIK
jgi:adenylylsulfate reductase subunit B